MTFRAHVVTSTLAGLIIIAAVWGYYKAAAVWNSPDTFMVVSVSVPDHRRGEDPQVTYSRTILREMRGVWTVELRRLGEPGETCHGTGAAIYSPKEYRELPLPFSVYVGVACDLLPGRYIMATRWDLTDDRGNSAVVLNLTEPFTVTAD